MHGMFLRGMVQSPLFYQTESGTIKIGGILFWQSDMKE